MKLNNAVKLSKVPVCYAKAVEMNKQLTGTVLDFGCGPKAYWKSYLETNLTRSAIWLHDKAKVTKENNWVLATEFIDYLDDVFDAVIVSNVLNCQESFEEIAELLLLVSNLSNKYIIINYPNSPRYSAVTTAEIKLLIKVMDFKNVFYDPKKRLWVLEKKVE